MAILIKVAITKEILDDELLKKADLSYVNDELATKIDTEIFDESVYVANSVISEMQAIDMDYGSRIRALEEQNPNLNTNIVNLATDRIGSVKIFMGNPLHLEKERLDGWVPAYVINNSGEMGAPLQYSKSEYSEAYEFFGDFYGAIIGDETLSKDYFYLPLTANYFLRSIGSYAQYLKYNEDSIKSFSLTSDVVQPTTQPHRHLTSGLFSGFANGGGLQIWDGREIEKYQGSRDSDERTVIINPFTVTSRYNGGEETRPKNIGVIYLYKVKNVIPQNISDNLNGSFINWKANENLSIENKFNSLTSQNMFIRSYTYLGNNQTITPANSFRLYNILTANSTDPSSNFLLNGANRYVLEILSNTFKQRCLFFELTLLNNNASLGVNSELEFQLFRGDGTQVSRIRNRIRITDSDKGGITINVGSYVVGDLDPFVLNGYYIMLKNISNTNFVFNEVSLVVKAIDGYLV